MKAQTSNPVTLTGLGWQPFFQQQLTLDEIGVVTPLRVVEQYRNEVELAGEFGKQQLALLSSMPQMVVGDWVLLNESGASSACLSAVPASAALLLGIKSRSNSSRPMSIPLSSSAHSMTTLISIDSRDISPWFTMPGPSQWLC